jgi:AbrB family looped-hinge helix DNA binding protein
MVTLTLSPKYQVVIPKAVRELLRLKPGQKIQVLAFEDRIELIPVQPVGKMRGFMRGIESTVDRDQGDRT